jgi:hypothetical protein
VPSVANTMSSFSTNSPVSRLLPRTSSTSSALPLANRTWGWEIVRSSCPSWPVKFTPPEKATVPPTPVSPWAGTERADEDETAVAEAMRRRR